MSGKVGAEQSECIDEKMQQDPGPDRIRAVIDIRKYVSQNKRWDQGNKVQMRRREDRRA